VLLKPTLLAQVQQPIRAIEESQADEASQALQSRFLAIRAAALRLVRNRAYPLWQRLFLLGVFCRRLDEIASSDIDHALPSFLVDFESTIAAGTLRAAMAVLPVNLEAQLDAVLLLAGMLLNKSNVTPRFVHCINTFATGIGNGPSATLETLTAGYQQAHDRYFDPFARRNPQILENYLVNTIFRCWFPFGRAGLLEGEPISMTREFAQLAAQFALMRGLLVGVAGFHRQGFSSAHVVHTVQSASKHFEHHPEFLSLAYNLLVEKGLDSAIGLATLLRNVKPGVASRVPRPAVPAMDVPGAPTGIPGLPGPPARPMTQPQQP